MMAAGPHSVALAPLTMRAHLATIGSMVSRAGNEILRVPGAAIPGVLAPTIFFLGLTAVFSKLTLLPGFTTESYQSFLIPVSLMQGAGFTGAATGVNLARDIESGLFDRFLASPAPRWVLLAGLVASAGLRALVPAAVLLIVAFSIGAHWPGFDGLAIALVICIGMGIAAACWGVMLALRFRSQAAAPLMQAGMLLLVLTTTAYAPQHLLTGWLADVAEINPVTHIVEGARQGFVASVTWAETWPAFAALAGMVAVLGLLALRGMRRSAY